MKYHRYWGYVILFLVFPACTEHDLPEKTVRSIRKQDTARINHLIRTSSELTWPAQDSARVMLRQALDLSMKAGYDKGVTSSLMSLGVLDVNLGAYNDGLVLFERGVEYALKQPVPDSMEIQRLYVNIAGVYGYAGYYQDAIDYSYKALGIATQKQAYTSIAMISNNIGSIFAEMGEMEKAAYYFSKSKEIAYRHTSARPLLPVLYLNEGELFLKKGEIDYSQEQCRQALKMSREKQMTDILCDAITLSGNIYAAKNMPEHAISSFREVLDMATDYPRGKMQAQISLGKIYTVQKQYHLAGQNLAAAADTARKLNARRDLINIYEHMSRMYQDMGLYADALDYARQYISLRDSVVNLEKVQSVNLFEIKYRTAQKDKEIAGQKLLIAGHKAHIIRKNTWITGITLGTVVLAAGFALFFVHRRRLEKQQQELAIWRATSEGEEKERRRVARDLHDGVGGLLSTLKMHFGILEKRMPAMAGEDVFREAMQLLDETVDEVRKTAHNLMPELLLRHGLTEAIRIYCDSVQHEEGLKINFQYYGFIGELNSGFQLSVYRIIQELVQNIIKHADASFALVQLSRHNHILDVTVEDNGHGIPAGKKNNTGMGLENIRSRVAELNGSFHINATPGIGTTVYIEFNLENAG